MSRRRSMGNRYSPRVPRPQRSASLRVGWLTLTGCSMSRMMLRPALAPSLFSGSNRIVAPLVPPVPSEASNVPAECHATRAAMGQALAFLLIRARRISLLMALRLRTSVMAVWPDAAQGEEPKTGRRELSAKCVREAGQANKTIVGRHFKQG